MGGWQKTKLIRLQLMRYLISRFFYILDRIYDYPVLLALGYFWRLELILRGAKIGKGNIYGRPVIKINPKSIVVIGENFSLVSDNRRCSSGSIYAPCRIQTHSASSMIIIGDNVGLNGASIVSRSNKITIGSGSMIAPNVVIMDSPFHRNWPPHLRNSYSENDLDRGVTIGDNVWIGTNCILLPGADIGSGSVVASRSVVNKSFPENSLIGGAPAQLIRKLDDSKSEANN
jgi:acetyltransferase-like isoleucine patch superfamily enzyme